VGEIRAVEKQGSKTPKMGDVIPNRRGAAVRNLLGGKDSGQDRGEGVTEVVGKPPTSRAKDAREMGHPAIRRWSRD
jgi:hypothetical protein